MIEILLPVYNGEKYLREQLNSILVQSNNDWILKIRNDGSTDSSQEVIDEYVVKYPNKIFNIPSPEKNLGLVRSINILLQSPPFGDYVMFSDQDDVWLENKIEMSLAEVKALEKSHPDLPAMICTDAVCVDSDLNILSDSFFKSQKFPVYDFSNPQKLIALNVVQGSTVLMNNLAREKVAPIPEFLNLHDMWMGLVVSQFGVVKYVHKPSLLYRQHAANTLGSLDVNRKYYSSKFHVANKIIKKLFLLKRSVPFKISVMKVIYYKLYFMLQRLFKQTPDTI